jgi:hypothetical protein
MKIVVPPGTKDENDRKIVFFSFLDDTLIDKPRGPQ